MPHPQRCTRWESGFFFFAPHRQVCDRAVVRITEPGFACRIWREGGDEWEQIQTPPGDYAEALRRQAAAFVCAIDGGPPMRTSIADAALTLDLCLQVLRQNVKG